MTVEVWKKGKRYKIKGLLICPKCYSRILWFELLTIETDDETFDIFVGFCLRCRHIFALDKDRCERCNELRWVYLEIVEPFATIVRNWFIATTR